MKKEWNQADIIDGTCDAGAFPSICGGERETRFLHLSRMQFHMSSFPDTSFPPIDVPPGPDNPAVPVREPDPGPEPDVPVREPDPLDPNQI
jgi:hypothetical protein